MHNTLIPRLKIFRPMLLALFILFSGGMAAAQDMAMIDETGFDRVSAVIFAYQRVGEDLFPANNLDNTQFRQQLQEMTEGDYNIAPLGDIVDALENNTPLPDRTIALTFSGAYQSALKNALPLLLEQNIPFTVFFSPDQADGKNPEYMGWSDLKRLRRSNLVTLGVHTGSYMHMAGETETEMRRQINNALTRYRQEFKADPQFFAYPFGEYTSTFRNIVEESGFRAAFGQQSGVAHGGSDLFSLPRFSMTENYGDESRFRMAALALPLPLTDIAPDDPYIVGDNPPTLGFTVHPSLHDNIPDLACFISEQGRPDMQLIGKNRVELRLTAPLRGPRIRLNCTMPAQQARAGEEQRWRWFGMLMTLENMTGEGVTSEDQAEEYLVE